MFHVKCTLVYRFANVSNEESTCEIVVVEDALSHCSKPTNLRWDNYYGGNKTVVFRSAQSGRTLVRLLFCYELKW